MLAALGEGLGTEVLAVPFEKVVDHKAYGDRALKRRGHALALQSSAKFDEGAGAVLGPGQELPIEDRALR